MSRSRSRSTSRRPGQGEPLDDASLALMWRRTVDALTPELLLSEISSMEPARRRFVLGAIGARDATHPNRAMAAQLMARLRSSGAHERELVGAVCLQGVATFSHDLSDQEWTLLIGDDPQSAAQVYGEHPEIAMFMHHIDTAPEVAMRRLHLLGGVTCGEGLGRFIALGLLAEHDPGAQGAYAQVYRSVPDLPVPPKLSDISPAARAAQLGQELPADAGPEEVHAAMVILGEPDDQPHDAPVSVEFLQLVVDEWDLHVQRAGAVLDDLTEDRVPDPEDFARLFAAVTTMYRAATEHDVHDRAGLARVLATLNPAAEPTLARPQLMRLAAVSGPGELQDALATVSTLATAAAHDQDAPHADALEHLLDLLDAAAARAAGLPTDLSATMAAQSAAMAGLPEDLSQVVFAAVAGFLTVPAPQVTDPAADTDRPGPVPAADRPQETTIAPAPEGADTGDVADHTVEQGDTPAPTEPVAAAKLDLDQVGAPHAEPSTAADEALDAEADHETGEPETAEADIDDEAEVGADTAPAVSSDLEAVDLLPDLPAALSRYITPAAAATPAPQPAPQVVEPATEQVDGPANEQVDELSWGEPTAADTDTGLLASGRYALAADLADALGAPVACVNARRLGAYAQQLRDPVGSMAAAFSAHTARVNREALGEDRAGQLLAWAAATKAALLAPSAGPADVLTNLTPCIASSSHLTEVSAALVEAARSGIVVVAPEAAAVAGAASAAHARTKDLADRAGDLATRAKHRTLKYLPAGDVYNAWLAPGGALHEVLTAVRTNDPDRVQEVSSAIVENLRGRAERNIDVVFTALRPKGRAGRIVAQPRLQLVARWDEIVDLAAEWVAAREEIAALEAADATGTWHSGALSRLRHRVAGHRDAALDALRALAADAGIAPDAPAGPVALLQDAFDACDGILPDGEEPAVAWVEHGELLNTALALEATTLTPEDPAALTAADLLAVAAVPVPAPADTYATLATRGAHDLTEVFLAGLQAVDPAAASTLETTRTRDVVDQDTRTRDKLTQLAADIDMRRVDGVLGDDLWTRAASQVEALAQPGRRDYERIARTAASITADLDTERTARISATVTHIAEQAAADATVAEHADSLTTLARAGQVTSAQEQLQQLLEGNPISTANDDAGHLRTFFPAVPQALCDAQVPLERINQALRTGTHTDLTTALASHGVDVLALSDPRRKQAREALTAWIDLSSPTPVAQGALSDTDRVRIVLRQAGIEFRTMTKATGTRDRSTFTLEGVEVIGNALTPTLGSERSPDGAKLRVVAVRKAPTPASIIESLSTQARDRTILVLWLARTPLTPGDWRAIAEAARGRPNPPAVVLDASVLAYLCAQAEPRLSTLAAVTLPFTATNPYRDTPGATAPEMFYGRHEERSQITDMNGSSFVSGGRQLGKSALLRHAAARFNATSPDHVAIVLTILNVGDEQTPAETVWAKLWPELVEAGIVPPTMPDTDNLGEAVLAAVRAWVKANPARRLLLMLDEADNFLDADAQGNRFAQVELFRRMMLDTDRAVKVVLAGLHRTARFENLPNQPLSHLGRPVVVGPLRPQHARALLTVPLAAIGYTFDSDVTIARVLAQANNMPAQLQLIGQALVAHMSAKPIDPAGPPTVIAAADVDAAFDPRLREELRDKFRLTLTLDPRYKVIAYVVAQAAHEHGSDASLSLAELSTACRGAWPEGFTGLGADAFRGLVTECVDLGVLAPDANRYRLRTPAVRRLLGTEIEVLEELDSASTNLTMPVAYDGSAFRRRISALEGAISPLTERQLGQVFARGGVVVIAGSTATGMDKVVATMEEVTTKMPRGGVAHRLANTRPEAVAAAIAKATSGTRLLVDARKAGHRQLATILTAAETAAAAHGRDVTVVVVAGPASAATWAGHPATVPLERVGLNGMRLLAGSDVLPFHDQGDQEAAVAATGGWLSVISHLSDLAAGPEHRYAADLIQAVRDDLATRRGRLAADVGLDASTPGLRRAVAHTVELTASAAETLDDIADLLEVAAGEDPAFADALTRDGYPGTRIVVDALVGLGVLTEAAPGLWAVEPVLATDLTGTPR